MQHININSMSEEDTRPAITCSKLTVETLEVNNKDSKTTQSAKRRH